MSTKKVTEQRLAFLLTARLSTLNFLTTFTAYRVRRITNDGLTIGNISNHNSTSTNTHTVANLNICKIRELIDAKLIELKHVSSAENEGDLFTKPLGKVTQNALRNKVMNMENTSTNTIHAGNAICGKHHSFETTIDMEIVNSMVALGA